MTAPNSKNKTKQTKTLSFRYLFNWGENGIFKKIRPLLQKLEDLEIYFFFYILTLIFLVQTPISS